MEEVLDVISSLDIAELSIIYESVLQHMDSKIDNILYNKLINFKKVLTLQGASDTEIEHSKICKLRGLGLIDKTEERRRITQLYSQ